MFYEVAAKAAVYLAALVAVGVPAARALVGRAEQAVELRLRRLAMAAAVFLLASLVVRAWAHTAGAFGPVEAFQWDNLRLVALESRWGMAWRWQAGASLLLVSAAALVARNSRGWVFYAAAALAVCSTLPLMGHAAGSPRVIVHAAHLAAGGLWLGTLGALAASALRPGAGDQSLGSTVVARFSPVALTGAAVAGLSGLILAYLYVASLANLIGTSYGLALILKLTAVFAAATCGFANWRRSRRGDAPSLPTVAIELTFAAGIVGATAVLSELEHP